MFIGVNVDEALRQLEYRRPQWPNGGPTGVLTHFGWTVYGPLSSGSSTDNTHRVHQVKVPEEDVKLLDIMERFWQLESFGSPRDKKEILSAEERKVQDFLQGSIKDIGGRYEMALPWKSKDIRLPNNKKSALRSLYANEGRFRVDAVFAQRYQKQVEQLVELKFARKLKLEEARQEPEGRTWYLPHFLVENPNKPEKPRLVFDASRKHEGVSLNDALHKGPDLLMKLPTLITRFREGHIGVSMDIVKMFLQVRVREEDQAALRFVWRKPGSSGPPETYQMMVEIFGATSSPTSVTLALRQIATDHPEYADVALKLLECFFVDNYLDSFDDIERAIWVCRRLVEMLAKQGFHLAQLITSSPQVWNAFPPPDRGEPELNIDLEGLPIQRTVGLLWDCQTDSFIFQLVIPIGIDTHRGILSSVASIFDPKGFIAPVILLGKILQQDAARLGRDEIRKKTTVDLDQKLPESMLQRWTAFVDGLPALRRL